MNRCINIKKIETGDSKNRFKLFCIYWYQKLLYESDGLTVSKSPLYRIYAGKFDEKIMNRYPRGSRRHDLSKASGKNYIYSISEEVFIEYFIKI